jgi:two-component system response regulator AlgR
MSRLSVLIVDDEPPARARLRRLVEGLDGARVVGEAGDGAAALAAVETLGPDVVLLDIRMPGMDGLAAAAELARRADPPAVIFTTAYGDHALAAFEAEAVDYLLKPVRVERLAQALGRAAERRVGRRQTARLPAGARTHFTVHERGGVRLLPVAEVIWFQADNKYVTAYTAAGEALLEDSLKGLEDEFGTALVRIHRNALVVRTALIGIERDRAGSHRAVLAGTSQRPEISRRHLAEVRDRLLAVSAG